MEAVVGRDMVCMEDGEENEAEEEEEAATLGLDIVDEVPAVGLYILDVAVLVVVACA